MIESQCNYNPDGTQTINVRYVVDVLKEFGGNNDRILSEIFKRIINDIASGYIEKHSAEILSKIDSTVIANLASIELGKRAVKEIEK